MEVVLRKLLFIHCHEIIIENSSGLRLPPNEKGNYH